MAMTKQYKPMVGRVFSFKNLIQTKEFPPNVLVVDEDSSTASFLDENGVMVKVSKFFFRSEPMPFPHFDNETTLTDAIVLIGKLNEHLAEAEKVVLPQGTAKKFRALSDKIVVALRSLAVKSVLPPA